MSEQGPSSVVQGRVDSEHPIQSHLARALLPLVRAKRTGALQVSTPALRPARTQIVIVDGHVAFAEGDTDASALLERLVQEGALGSTQAVRIERRILEERGWSGMVKASELSVSEGHVRPEVALKAISDVVRSRVSWCLRLEAAEWIYRDDPRAGSVPRYPVAFEKLVLEAVEHPDAAPRFQRALGRYAGHYPRLEGESNENTTLFGMTPARFRTLRLLDGNHTLADILTQSPMGATEASGFIAGLTIFERIWWNTTPTPRTPTGTVAAQPRQAPPRPVTIERPPTSIEELRALGRARAATPPPKSPSGVHLGASPGGAVPPPMGSAALSELLRRGAHHKDFSARAPTPSPAVDNLSAKGHFDRGKTHLSAGRLPAASADFARALELEPGNRSYLLQARFVAYLQAPAGPSRAGLEKELHDLAALRLREDDRDASAHHVLGRLHFDAGDDVRALRSFKLAERLAPSDFENTRYLRLLAARAKK